MWLLAGGDPGWHTGFPVPAPPALAVFSPCSAQPLQCDHADRHEDTPAYMRKMRRRRPHGTPP